MNSGRVTIPTDKICIEETKQIIKYWGADAISDCDGVSLPDNLKQFNTEVYKAYFIVREDHEYAKAHKEYWQNVALTTERQLATDDILCVDLMKNLFKESLEVNTDNYKKYWQVIDRTIGKTHDEWEYIGDNTVK